MNSAMSEAALPGRFTVAEVGERLRRHSTVFRDPAVEALSSLRAHKLRSALTLLGVTLSVSVLILVVSIITGANLYIENKVANLGANVFLVMRFPIITNQQDFFKAMRRNRNVTWEDFEALHSGMKLPRAVGLEVRTEGHGGNPGDCHRPAADGWLDGPSRRLATTASRSKAAAKPAAPQPADGEPEPAAPHPLPTAVFRRIAAAHPPPPPIYRRAPDARGCSHRSENRARHGSDWPTSRPRSRLSAPTCSEAIYPTAWSGIDDQRIGPSFGQRRNRAHRDNGVMASPLAGLPDELAGRQVGQGVSSLVLPDGPHYPRIVQAWLWLKRPTWFLDRCSRAYGDVFTMRLPLGMNMVHIAHPELVKAVFSGGNDVLRAGEANATVLGPLVGPHSVLVLDGAEHIHQRKLILPAFHGDRMRAWEATIRDITRAEIVAGRGQAVRAPPEHAVDHPGRRHAGRVRCRRKRAPAMESSSLGRWEQRDPMGLKPDLNEYRVDGDSPVRRVDPNGTDWSWSGNAGGAGVGGAGGAGAGAAIGVWFFGVM